VNIFTWRGKARVPERHSLRRYKNSAVPAVLASLLAFAVSCPAYAQQKTLRVAMWGEYMPLHGFVQGKAVGFEADLANYLGKYMNRRVVFVDTRGKGMSSIEAVARGEADIALNAITPTPEREQIVGFTKPYLTLHYRVISRPDKQLIDVQDLVNSKVAAPEGPALAALRRRVGDKALSAPSLNAAVDMLKKAEIDFVFGDEVGLIAAGQGTDFILTGESLGKAEIAAAVQKSEVRRYNEALRNIEAIKNIGSHHSGLPLKWQPSIDPEESHGIAVSPEPRVSDQELRLFEQGFKQAVKSQGIDAPITALEKRVVNCAVARPSYPRRRCSEALERAQDTWKGAWPTVLRINGEDGEKRISHVLLDADYLDTRSISIGTENCTTGEKPLPTVKKPRRPRPSDNLHCRTGEGSIWTAHTRTGRVRAILDELRFEPHETFEPGETPEGSALVAYFQVEQQRGVLFISTMPLRLGTSEYIAAEKKRIEQNGIPESVRRSFREKILRMSDWTEKAWDAYRVPGSDGEGIAMVESEAFAGPMGQRTVMIALVRWAAGGEVDFLYRTEFLPDADEHCGHPKLKIEGFFDFDGDGDLDVLLNNNNPFANGLYLLLRVDGGFRAVEFKNGAPCMW